MPVSAVASCGCRISLHLCMRGDVSAGLGAELELARNQCLQGRDGCGVHARIAADDSTRLDSR